MKFMQTTRFLLLAIIGRNWQFVSTIFCNPLVHRMGTMVKIGGGPTPITPETDQILPVGHGQEWSRMVKNVFP